jgi:MYXO-CTERM domain-containing protein
MRDGGIFGGPDSGNGGPIDLGSSTDQVADAPGSGVSAGCSCDVADSGNGGAPAAALALLGLLGLLGLSRRRRD